MTKDLQFIYRLNKKWTPQTIGIVKAGGQTNRNYIVSFQGKKFFVRLPWESNVLDRKIEGRNILALSRNKTVQRILPKYYIYVLSRKNILDPKDKNIYNVPNGTMVIEYVQGREFTMKDFCQQKYQKALAQMFYIFHKSGVRFQNPYNVFRDEIGKYRKKAQSLPLKRFFDKKTLSQLLLLEKEAEQKLPSLKKGVSTHNDFIFQNFLVGEDKKIYLLDFEYAGFNVKGGIFYDLGYIFRDSFFNPPQMNKKVFERFLIAADKVYKRKLDRNQIYWSVVAAMLVGIWWGVLRYFSASKKEQPYFYRYVQRGIKGLLAMTNELKEKES